MREFFADQLQQEADVPANHPVALGVIATLWSVVQMRMGDLPQYEPLFWMSLFWFCDFLLGSAVAIRASWLLLPEGRWSPSKAARSVVKWFCWSIVISVTFGLRKSGQFGLSAVASVIECVICAAEATSALRNAGKLQGAQWLERFSDAADSARDRVVDEAIDHLKSGAITTRNGEAHH